MVDQTIQPYAGIKVLDMSQGLAGPYCAEILLQNGADVTKVEPLAGDWGRGMGKGKGGMTATVIANNYGKRSICIDASVERGRELLRRMVAASDVLIESFRPDVMPRLGLSYADLRQINPTLVYVSVNGFGCDGPHANRPATDSVLQAVSGMMAENCDADGVPRKVGLIPVIDATTGVYAAQAAGAALFRRAVRGEGAHVKVSLLHSAAAIQAGSILRSFAGSEATGVPKGVFKTADGYINVFTVHDKMFKSLCRALKREEWLQDSRYNTSTERSAHSAEMTAEAAAVLKENTSAHWVQTLSAHDVVCAPINNYSDLLNDEQVRHAKMFDDVDQGAFGRIPASRVPGVDPNIPLRPSPEAGAHTREILAEHGLGPDEIDALIAARVVGVMKDVSR